MQCLPRPEASHTVLLPSFPVRVAAAQHSPKNRALQRREGRVPVELDEVVTGSGVVVVVEEVVTSSTVVVVVLEDVTGSVVVCSVVVGGLELDEEELLDDDEVSVATGAAVVVELVVVSG